MDYQELLRKKELYSRCRSSIPEFTLFTFEQAFEIEYTHNSTVIEGNTLSLIETKVLLEDRLEYFKTLDAYAVEGNLQPFADLVAGLVDIQLERYIELSGPQQDMDMLF